MAKKDEEEKKQPTFTSGDFERVWGRASGHFETHQETLPSGKKGAPEITKLTNIQDGIHTDVGFAGGHDIGQFSANTSLASGMGGGGLDQPGSHPLNVEFLRGTFEGTVRQVQLVSGENLLEAHTTADIINSSMVARGVSGNGQVSLKPAPGVSITVLPGRGL